MSMLSKVSNSKLNQYRTCPRSYFYSSVCRIEPIEEGEAEHDRSFGSAIHTALETLYKGGSVAEAQARLVEEYPKQLVDDDLAKTPDNGKKLIEAYWQRFGPQLKDWRVVAVEVLDEYEPIPGVTFRVKLDLVAENLKYGGIYCFDWKTTGKNLDYRYWAQFNPNAQVSTYFDYVTKKFGQCAGFYVDAMSFGYRKNKYKGEPAGFHYNIDRQLFSQTKDQLDDWRQSEASWLKLMEQSEQEGNYPMNTLSCRYCSFRPICAAGWSWETDKDLIMCQYKEREQAEKIIEAGND